MTRAEPARSSGVMYVYGNCGTLFLASRLNRPPSRSRAASTCPPDQSPATNRTNQADIFGSCCAPNRNVPAALLGTTSTSKPPPRAPSGVLSRRTGFDVPPGPVVEPEPEPEPSLRAGRSGGSASGKEKVMVGVVTACGGAAGRPRERTPRCRRPFATRCDRRGYAPPCTGTHCHHGIRRDLARL